MFLAVVTGFDVLGQVGALSRFVSLLYIIGRESLK
jgi:hypothetical protein